MIIFFLVPLTTEYGFILALEYLFFIQFLWLYFHGGKPFSDFDYK